jgi:cyclase
MLIRQILPVLDVFEGRLVKTEAMGGFKDLGDPLPLARHYARTGADGLVLLDAGTPDRPGQRHPLCSMLRAVDVGVPLIAGGGVSCREDFEVLLEAGATGIAVNTAAIESPDLIDQVAASMGSEVIVASVDARWAGRGWRVHSHKGRRPTTLDAVEWCAELQSRGAGTLLLTSMDREGTGAGFDVDLVRYLREVLDIPVWASGGAGRLEHFIQACQAGASGVAAASMFHFGTVTLLEVKEALDREGFGVQLGQSPGPPAAR